MIAEQRIPDKQWSRIIAKAWADDAFRDRLLADPKAVLLEHGFQTRRDVCVILAETPEMESTDEVIYLALPPRPDDLSEEELLPVGVAYCFSGGCMRCGRCGCGCGGCGICGICGLCGAV
ncbi:MAG: nitrile hydratase subunit alpha [Isosphaeraceae bacterium]